MYRAFSLSSLLALALFAPQASAEDLIIRTEVLYSRGMIICVGEQGVSAVRFEDPFSIANETGNGIVGVSYQWRYLAKDSEDGKELTGKGRLFVNMNDGKEGDGESFVKCGPLEIQWQHKDVESGFIKFDPRNQAIYVVSASYFDLLDQAEKRLRLDLRTFHAAKPAGLFSEKKEPPGKPFGAADLPNFLVAANVRYQDHVTIVQYADGLAVFEFADDFTRKVSENEVRYGVHYTPQFIAANGQERDKNEPTEERFEVFEAYKNGTYSSAESNLSIVAGNKKVEWSRGGSLDGWLYYDPTKIRIWNCHAEDSRQLIKLLKESQLSDAQLSQDPQRGRLDKN